MYEFEQYLGMITDSIRVRAYLQALEEVITPGCSVVEIGTGLGFFAFAALRLGAAKVFAIECSPSIEIARSLCRANGLEDRCFFYEQDSRTVELPERCDVLLSDLRGGLPFHGNHIQVLQDARTRFLKPGGRMIPWRDQHFACLTRAFPLEASLALPGPDPFDWTPCLQRLQHQATRWWGQEKELLTPAQKLGEWNYTTVSQPDFQATAAWTVSQPASIGGVLVWFDAQLTEAVSFSNSPTEVASPRSYGQTCCSVWPPLLVEAGATVCLDWKAKSMKNDYALCWEVGSSGVWRRNCSLFAKARPRGDQPIR